METPGTRLGRGPRPLPSGRSCAARAARRYRESCRALKLLLPSIRFSSTLVIGKEKGAVLHDRTAQVAAELVQPERLLRGVERIAGVEHVVAEEFEDASVDLVRAG